MPTPTRRDIRDTVADMVSTYHPADAPDEKKTA
jgi:hypothetical protein